LMVGCVDKGLAKLILKSRRYSDLLAGASTVPALWLFLSQ